ncbi:MAG TPA: hypothetical protein VMN39_04235, partial [Longimicrobiaceae bacterium]|nr:hypothetical protein [Longimicrobiaceae bacterium]
ALYDDRGDNTLVAGPRTRIDTRSSEAPEPAGNPLIPPTGVALPTPRDWGGARSLFSPQARWDVEIGPVIGGGPSWTRYGFRRVPFATQTRLALVYAPLHGRVGLEGTARFRRTGGGGETRWTGRATQVEMTRFHGLGNDTPPESASESDSFRVWANVYALSADLIEEVARNVRFTVGSTVAYREPEPYEGSPASEPGVIGGRAFGVGGIHGELSLGGRSPASFPRRGIHFQANLAGYPLVWGDATEAFARGGVTARAYLPLPGPLEPTLAVRAGGERVLGLAPFQHAAYLGGASTLRGHRRQRFAGEAAVHGGAELRTTLGLVNLHVIGGELGALALIDAGRVYRAGERSDRWHTARGGGLWFGTGDRAVIAHLVYAHGEDHMLHAGIGVPF